MTLFAFAQKAAQDVASRGRLTLGAFLAPNGTLRSRSGFLDSADAVMTVVGATMQVSVSSFRAFVDGGSLGQGVYPVVNTAGLAVTLPDGGGAPTVYNVGIRIKENTFDGSGGQDCTLEYWLPGAPPSGTLLPVRQVTVPAGKNAGNGGLVSGNLGTDLRVYTAAAGGIVNVANQAERDAWANAKIGQMIYRLDNNIIEVKKAAGWKPITEGQVTSFAPDGGFPTSFSGVTSTPQVVLRYTIAAAAFNRRINAVGTSFLGYTQANDLELAWFNGATAVGRTQLRMSGANGQSFVAVGAYDLAAGASSVLELRATRIGGTGTMSNSAGVYNSGTVIATAA